MRATMCARMRVASWECENKSGWLGERGWEQLAVSGRTGMASWRCKNVCSNGGQRVKP